MPVLLVEPSELVEIIVVDAVAALDRIELLTASAEVKTLPGSHVSRVSPDLALEE